MMEIIPVLSALKNSTYKTATSNHAPVDTRSVHFAGITFEITSTGCVQHVDVHTRMNLNGNLQLLKSIPPSASVYVNDLA